MKEIMDYLIIFCLAIIIIYLVENNRKLRIKIKIIDRQKNSFKNMSESDLLSGAKNRKRAYFCFKLAETAQFN